MKTVYRIVALLALLLLPLWVLADETINEAINEAITVCDRNISNPEHPFYATQLKPLIPADLSPSNVQEVYKQFLQLYRQQLQNHQKQLPLVKHFLELQQNISGENPELANLSITRSFDGEELSSGATKVFDIPCADIDKDYLIDIIYLSLAYQRTHSDSWGAIRAATTRQIISLGQLYENWFQNGLPMWPQETWFNGLFLDDSDAIKPVRHQYVLFRPNAGLGFNTRHSFEESKTEATLGIEALGYVRYINNDYSNYWGISALITTGDDVGLGYGLLARYNNYALGITRRNDKPELGISEDDIYLFIGIDLYKMLHEKNEQFQGYKMKIIEHKRQVCQRIDC